MAGPLGQARSLPSCPSPPPRHSSWRSEDSCWARSESHCNYAHTCSYSPLAQPAGLETSARQPPALRGLSAPWPRRPPFPLQPQSECFGSRNQSRLMESFPTPTSHLSHSPQPGVGCGEGPPHCVAPPFCASQKGEAVTRDAATSQADGAQEGCGDWGPLAGRTSPQPSLDTSSRAHGPLLPLAIACEPCLGAVVLPGGQERGLRLPGSELEEMALVASLAPRCYTLPTPAPCLSHPALFPAVLWAGLWPYYKPCCISVVSTCPVPHPNALWTRPASSPGWAQRAGACP